MGLLEFARDVGRRVFDADAQAGRLIKEHLEIKMSGIADLEVDYDDGHAIVRGRCRSASDRELAALIVGDIKGVQSVNIDALHAPEAELETVWEVAYHVVEPGDTLGLIAKRYLGKASAYVEIFEANRGLLKHPDKIYPGQKIRIPMGKRGDSQ